MKSEIQSESDKIICPDFLVIGVTKGGTTSIHNYLQQHPEICMTEPKEPGYLSSEYHTFKNVVSDRKDYDSRFKVSNRNEILGDATPWYIHSPSVPHEAFQINKKMKFVVVLRQPVLRAYSHYNHLVNLGHLPNEPFEDYFNTVSGKYSKTLADPKQCFEFSTGKNAPISHSYYSAALSMFLDVFSLENILIRVYEEYESRFDVLLREIHSFLEVSKDSVLDISKSHNVSTMPRSSLVFNSLRGENIFKTIFKRLLPDSLSRYIGNFIDNKNRCTPSIINESDKDQFTKSFYEDISRTENLINKDLSIWK